MFSKYVLPLILLVAAIGTTGLLIANRPTPAREPQARPPVQVNVIPAQREPVTFMVESQGEVLPRTATTLVTEVSGQILETAPGFVAGGTFNTGDVLLRIDPRNHATQVQRAEAGVARARTQIATENALAGYALDDWKRLRELRATEREASDLALRKPQLAAAMAELEAAEADLKKARDDLSRTVIRAPYAGMVRNKRADTGQYVNTGTPVAEIFATDHAEVRLPLTAADLAWLDLPAANDSRAGSPVQLTASVGLQDHRWKAALVRSEGVFDSKTRVLYGVARIDDPYALESDAEPLRVGTFVSASITGRDAGLLYRLPRTALAGDNQVWIIDADERLRSTEVHIVRRLGDDVFIDHGLKDGDRICTTRIPGAVEGMIVRVRDV
jgi:RND family efflux transporter MFP subunit